MKQELIDKLFDYLETILPHGSGINGDWNFSYSQSTKNVKMSNCFSIMENGMYVHHAPFTAIINWSNPDYFKLQFHGDRSRYYADKHDLRNYLTDTICETLYEGFGGLDLGLKGTL